jgi:hypothetical protein
VDPLRVRRTHVGSSKPVRTVAVEVPPVAERRMNSAAPPGVTLVSAWRAPASSDSRIMTPALAHRWVSSRASMRADTSRSPAWTTKAKWKLSAVPQMSEPEARTRTASAVISASTLPSTPTCPTSRLVSASVGGDGSAGCAPGGQVGEPGCVGSVGGSPMTSETPQAPSSRVAAARRAIHVERRRLREEAASFSWGRRFVVGSVSSPIMVLPSCHSRWPCDRCHTDGMNLTWPGCESLERFLSQRRRTRTAPAPIAYTTTNVTIAGTSPPGIAQAASQLAAARPPACRSGARWIPVRARSRVR